MPWGLIRCVQALISILIILIGEVSAATSNTAIFEQLNESPPGWTRLGDPAPSTIIPLRLAVSHGRDWVFEQRVLAISTPGDPQYRQFLSFEEIKDMLRPSQNVSQTLIGWLTSSGVPQASIEDEGDWINFNVSVSTAEKLLNAKYAVYSSGGKGQQKIRTTSYSVPAALHKYVRAIFPTVQFDFQSSSPSSPGGFKTLSLKPSNVSTPARTASNPRVNPCNNTITPSCLRELYQLANLSTLARSPSSSSGPRGIFAITELEGHGYNNADLQRFLREYAPYASGRNLSVVWTGDDGDFQRNTEADLDVQYALPLSHPVPAELVVTPAQGWFDLPLPDMLKYLIQLPDEELPHTISSSYGIPESFVSGACMCSPWKYQQNPQSSEKHPTNTALLSHG